MARPRQDTPWLDQRNGIFYAFWNVSRIDPRGKSYTETKRLSLRTRDHVEAQARFAAFLTEGRSLIAERSGDAVLTVSAMLDDYYREHVEEEVVDKVRQENAMRYLRVFFGEDPVSTIDVARCKAYTKARREGSIVVARDKRGRKSGRAVDDTIRREIVVLRAAFGHAVKMRRVKGLKSDEMPQFYYPTDKRDAEEGGEAPWLRKAQLEQLRAAARRSVAKLAGEVLAASEKGEQARLELSHDVACRVRDFIEIAYYTASRRDAIERLDWSQVRFADGCIHLAKVGEKRTKKRRPVVPIDEELLPILERLHRERTNEYVLGSPNDLYRPFKRLCVEIGVDASPHVLRHSRATHLLQDDVSLYAVAGLLGDTVATVERVYGHHCAEHLRRALSKKTNPDGLANNRLATGKSLASDGF